MPTHQITKLDNGRPSSDGNLIRFEASTRSGEALTLEMPTQNIGNFMAFLCGLAQVAARQSKEEANSKVFEGALIEATSLGLATGRAPGETILSAALGPFSIGLAVPTPAIAALLQQADLGMGGKKH